MNQNQNQAKSPQSLCDNSPLARKLRGAAHNLAFELGTEPDDMEQEIVLAILERFASDPTFLDNKDAYVVSHGAWKARDAVRMARRRTHADQAWTYDDEDDEDRHAAMATDPWAEVDRELSLPPAYVSNPSEFVADVIAGLEENDRQIAKETMGGLSPRQIAPSVGLHWRTVYNRLHGPIAHGFIEAGYLA